MKIEQITEKFQIDPGAPMPTILSNDYKLYLIFYKRGNKDDEIVTIMFDGYAQVKYGSPNDEAINGHPYYSLGLEAYSIQKVIDSDWIKALTKMNAVHPRHKDEHFSKYQHYIFFFHDSCFEIVAEEYVVESNPLPNMQDEIQRVAKLL